ncbi:hypothetical protein OQJ13_06110 [Legionella sp. PATHC035]|uniref:hypothetical protein n=1 Tax=Legionella sp. PATHC035 TaxID=2992040 RepID=UPI00224404DE|nr:hypothetical protein [Legionella sp. PATHC035]MCW8408545.1 hypothetical protein [Legionella sp. PATHC035]
MEQKFDQAQSSITALTRKRTYVSSPQLTASAQQAIPPPAKKLKSASSLETSALAKGKEKEASTPTRASSKKGSIIRQLISPDLNAFIEQQAQGDPQAYQQIQREMLRKNAAYNRRLSMQDISLIGQSDDFSDEVEDDFPEPLRTKFIYSLHTIFPFTVKRTNTSLPRSALYQDETKRRQYVAKEIIPNIKINPSLAAQNLIYLYQHHLMYSLYLQRKSGDQLGELLTYHLDDLYCDLSTKEIKKLKSAINVSYKLIKRKKPFKNLVMGAPMAQVETPVEVPQDSMSEGNKMTKITLFENLDKKINMNDVFDEPFSASLKIVQDTNFYDEKGKLIGIYRIGAIQPDMISDRLRDELAAVTQSELNKMGAGAAEETKKPKNGASRNIRSAPFGILETKQHRIRPTQFSETKFAIEEGLAPLIATAETIYAESAPLEYARRCQVMGYASSFTLNGSKYLLAAKANYDKQTTAHVDDTKFPLYGLSPLFVIYPNSQDNTQRTYKGSYTFFPGVFGFYSRNPQPYFEGIYFDLNEGDLLSWDFDKYVHCNTKLVPTNGVTQCNWHRISIIGFSNGEALDKLVAPLVFEDSDDEDSVLLSTEGPTSSEQSFGELALSEVTQTGETSALAKGKKKEASTSTPAPPKKGQIIRKLISPDLNAFIEQQAEGNPRSYELVQREMLQKNEAYNCRLSMQDISSIGQRDDLRNEIKRGLPERLRTKFIYSHHITFPFTVKKTNTSLSRSALYQDETKRRRYVAEEIIPNIKINPSLAAQNLIYLYQHHLMYSLYLQRKSGNQLGQILIDHLAKLNCFLSTKEIKKLKSAINASYELIKNRKPFKNLVMGAPMVQVETPVEVPQDSMSDEDKIRKITLSENPNKKVNIHDVFDEPFSNSLKIMQDTNFYDDNGKLIGIYRVGAVKPDMISDRLRKAFASVTQKQLNRMGAGALEEVKQKNGASRNIHSAPFGILGIQLSRIRPTQFSEKKFAIEEGLAPLFATAETIYAESAPLEYARRCQVMGYASSFMLNGSNYLLAAKANYDKQTTAHVDDTKFPLYGLSPLFVIYPAKSQRTYEGLYTFFPGVCGSFSSDAQSSFEGIYFDLNEGDLLLWDFDKYVHCNTKLVPTNGVTQCNWHRISIIGFSKGEALNKIVAPLVFEDSDDEDSALLSTEGETSSEQSFGELALSEVTQTGEHPDSFSSEEFWAEFNLGGQDTLDRNGSDGAENMDWDKLMDLDFLLPSDKEFDLDKPDNLIVDNSLVSGAAQKTEESRPPVYVQTNLLNFGFFKAPKRAQQESPVMTLTKTL